MIYKMQLGCIDKVADGEYYSHHPRHGIRLIPNHLTLL